MNFYHCMWPNIQNEADTKSANEKEGTKEAEPKDEGMTSKEGEHVDNKFDGGDKQKAANEAEGEKLVSGITDKLKEMYTNVASVTDDIAKKLEESRVGAEEVVKKATSEAEEQLKKAKVLC